MEPKIDVTTDEFGIAIMDSIVFAITKACKDTSQKAVATRLGVSRAHINDVINGRRYPGTRMLKALGFEAFTLYRKVN